jgi:hypothetical protein
MESVRPLEVVKVDSCLTLVEYFLEYLLIGTIGFFPLALKVRADVLLLFFEQVKRRTRCSPHTQRIEDPITQPEGN